MPSTPSTVLILGARGRFGLATARAFADAGWRVLAQTRPGALVPQEAAADARLEWLGIDLHHARALTQAAKNATVVVHALNPAYTHKAWHAQVLPMMDHAIEIARGLQATLMMPGNIYNFGTGMPAMLCEDTPQLAKTVKGQIRIGMEARLQRSDVHGVVIGAGDFFGSGRGTWFDAIIMKNAQKGVFTYPGHREVSTAWAYLPDLARTFVAVAQKRAQLQRFDVFHFAGHAVTGQQWLDALAPLARTQGWVKPDAHVKFTRLPWAVIRLGAWVNPTWAALTEMRYLWDTPHALANDELTALIGPEPHTALAQALRTALADMGMINPVASATLPGVAAYAAAQR